MVNRPDSPSDSSSTAATNSGRREERQAVFRQRGRRPELTSGRNRVTRPVAHPQQTRPVPAAAPIVDHAHEPVEVAAVDQFVQQVVVHRLSVGRLRRGHQTSGQGYRRPVGSVGYRRWVTHHAARPCERLDLVVGEECRDRQRHALAERPDAFEQRVVDRFVAELPDHRAQLVVGREAQPVVDAPDRGRPVAVGGQEQHVAALAVGVVGEDVEQRHRPEPVVQVRVRLVDREVVLAVIGGDEPLHRAFPEGPSRSTVGGTTCSPRCSLRRYVATSRRCSPGSKSHSGRSPRTGL